VGYLGDEPPADFGRYFTWQSLFLFAMNSLVLAPNLLQLFLGWELVGGQGEQAGELLLPGRGGAVGGQRLDLQERHGGLAGLALLGGACQTLNHLGKGQRSRAVSPRLQLATQFLPGFSNGSCRQA
jgi:hypothetical protein